MVWWWRFGVSRSKDWGTVFRNFEPWSGGEQDIFDVRIKWSVSWLLVISLQTTEWGTYIWMFEHIKTIETKVSGKYLELSFCELIFLLSHYFHRVLILKIFSSRIWWCYKWGGWFKKPGRSILKYYRKTCTK